MSTCPSCGEVSPASATFCEACGEELAGSVVSGPPLDPPSALEAASALNPVSAPDPASALDADPAAEAAAPGEPPLAPAAGPWPGLRAQPQSQPPSQPAAPATPTQTAAPAAPTQTVPAPDRCSACTEGTYQDGYCDQCGSPRPDPRRHAEVAPSSWVAGCCDIGRNRARNEDAMALWALEPPLSRAAVVVCDGVSTAPESHLASEAACQAAVKVLGSAVSQTSPAALEESARRLLGEAVLAANEAVVAVSQPGGSPSCTFVAALVHQGRAFVGTLGDSRVYWVPDAVGEEPRQLGRDDSWLVEQLSLGIPYEQAAAAPQAHAITRWLGPDAPDDLTPHFATVPLDRAGWLLACSDGLWNYYPEPRDLQALIATMSGLGPAALASALVDAANAAGGRDNITVALIRSDTASKEGTDG